MRTSPLWTLLSTLLILSAVFGQGARIMSIGGRNDSTPFFSANDRSRWCTIASLVEEHTYEIDTIIAIEDKNGALIWNTIDKVRHPGPDGEQHYYSSKPPLLATIYAGVYQLIYLTTGRLLTEEPFFVGRILLLIVNLIPLAIFWWWASRWIADELQGVWARTILLLFVIWGTFLISFANTLSNHLSGALAIALSIAAWRAMERMGKGHFGWLILAGLGTGLGVASDLPALSWLVALMGIFILRFGWSTILPYAIGIAPVAIGFALTNFLAHGELIPAYAHRGPGKEIVSIEKLEGADKPDRKAVQDALKEAGHEVVSLTKLRPAGRLTDQFELSDESGNLRYAIVEKTEGQWTICEWGDWYDYPGSYWLQGKPKGVDQGEPSQMLYAFHVFIGHHGIFSLTPFWFLGVWGSVGLLRSQDSGKRWMLLAIAAVTVVCIAFYLTRPLIDRNYGGVSCGFRWTFWMIPLWIVPTIEGVRSIRRIAWLRRASELALGVSLFSSLYAWTNPWVHPWIYQLLTYFQ